MSAFSRQSPAFARGGLGERGAAFGARVAVEHFLFQIGQVVSARLAVDLAPGQVDRERHQKEPDAHDHHDVRVEQHAEYGDEFFVFEDLRDAEVDGVDHQQHEQPARQGRQSTQSAPPLEGAVPHEDRKEDKEQHDGSVP